MMRGFKKNENEKKPPRCIDRGGRRWKALI